MKCSGFCAVACQKQAFADVLEVDLSRRRVGSWRVGSLALSISCCLFLQAVDLHSQVSAVTNLYEFRQQHDSESIGKFYMGREIARVMGHDAADWLERPERDKEEHTEMLVEQLKLLAGDVVADIGAGTGYFSRRLAKKVGPAGKIFAVDVQPEMLNLLTNSSASLGLTNIIPVLGSVTNPGLSAGSVDVVLMVDVYHEFEFPYETMEAICRAVKPGGRIIFVEYRGEDPAVPIKPLHKMTEVQVKKEMSALPVEWVHTIEVLPRQHIIVFRNRTQQPN
jgi:SAM-dependent methyltransferase